MAEKYDLKKWFKDQVVETKNKHKAFDPFVTKLEKEEVVMLFNGMELILESDGTYILIDTTGG